MLLVYESRYYFIVCVEIDNALGTTIYFPSVIRDTGSDKFQPVHALLLSFHSPSSLSLSLCIYVPIFPYFLYSFEMTDRAWISTSYPFFGKKFSATEKGVHTLFFSLFFFPPLKERSLSTYKKERFLPRPNRNENPWSRKEKCTEYETRKLSSFGGEIRAYLSSTVLPSPLCVDFYVLKNESANPRYPRNIDDVRGKYDAQIRCTVFKKALKKLGKKESRFDMFEWAGNTGR